MISRRILIIGWPKAGKTTLGRELAAELGLEHLCTDPQERCPPDLHGTPQGLEWSERSQYVAVSWLGRPAVIEGTAVPRALRKWRNAHPGAPPPADRLIWLTRTYGKLLQGQISMGKGMDTVMAELADWLAPIIEKK